MSYIDYDRSCLRLLNTLRELGFTIDQSFITPDNDSKGGLLPKKWIKRTRLYQLMLSVFGEQTNNWLKHLKDTNYVPDWHYILVDPRVSPIDSDDWIMLSDSKTEALAYVLEWIQNTKANLIETKVNELGDITFEGEAGPLATISKINFDEVSESGLKRSITALKGLNRSDSEQKIHRAFNKIEGLHFDKEFKCTENEQDTGTEGYSTNAYTNRQLIFNSSNNLVTNLLNVLPLFVSEKVPRNVAQDLVSSFCEIQSMNHFKALEVKRSFIIEVPYILVNESADNPLYEILGCYRGMPAGLYAFGQTLLELERKTFNVKIGMFFQVTNLTETPFNPKSYNPSSLWPYEENSGLSLKLFPFVSPSEEYLYTAATFLESPSLSKELNEFFHASIDGDVKARIIELNKRHGAKPEDHIFCGDWVYWRGNKNGYSFFRADKLSEIGKSVNDLQIPASELHKASIVEHQEKYWLATDWDQDPEYLLPDLDSETAELIEKEFFDQSNWRMETLAKYLGEKDS